MLILYGCNTGIGWRHHSSTSCWGVISSWQLHRIFTWWRGMWLLYSICVFWYNVWLWQLPLTTSFPGLWSVLVMDNARIHHSQEIKDLVHSYGASIFLLYVFNDWSAVSGCRIEFLPPYSPDYNPIELAFSAIKNHLQHNGISFYSTNSLYSELYRACDVITPEMMWGFFAHSGYLFWSDFMYMYTYILCLIVQQLLYYNVQLQRPRKATNNE